MARTIAIDLDWTARGYLFLPDGHCRHIIGLDAITRDIIAVSARLSWADLPGNHAAFCHVESRHILLAPWLYWSLPTYLRSVLTHELAHCITGRSCERARLWQQRFYGEPLEPAWA